MIVPGKGKILKCAKCGRWKKPSEFRVSRLRPNGRQPACFHCQIAWMDQLAQSQRLTADEWEAICKEAVS